LAKTRTVKYIGTYLHAALNIKHARHVLQIRILLIIARNVVRGATLFRGIHALTNFAIGCFQRKIWGSTVLAHNSRDFDSQFLLKYLQEHGTVAPSVIVKGLEVISLKVGGIRVIDTLNFLPMPLAAMSKTFSINELKKGHFPHFFNTKDNHSYVGLLPDAKYYNPDSMKSEARDEFFKWNSAEKAKNPDFDINKEISEYCDSNVDILRKCTLKFREIFVSETGVDPLLV